MLDADVAQVGYCDLLNAYAGDVVSWLALQATSADPMWAGWELILEIVVGLSVLSHSPPVSLASSVVLVRL